MGSSDHPENCVIRSPGETTEAREGHEPVHGTWGWGVQDSRRPVTILGGQGSLARVVASLVSEAIIGTVIQSKGDCP